MLHRLLSLATADPLSPADTQRGRADTFARRACRSLLLRASQAEPRPSAVREADRRVTIVLASAWGMGGTIRAALNLAEFLVEDHDVEIISAHRRRDEPFMGELPRGVAVTALDDQRPGAQRGITGRVASLLRRVPSVLAHPADVAGSPAFTLWSDIQLVRRLRGGAGVVIGTRPTVNLILADLGLPGFVKIGEEQMHLGAHRRPLRRAMRAGYPKLDALAVLTRTDRAAYEALLGPRAPRLVRLPNTVHSLDEQGADLGAKVVLAAGRATPQKGFDLLIRAWAQVTRAHPDWLLRLNCHGQSRKELELLAEELGLGRAIRIRSGTSDLPGRMRRSAIYALSSRYEGFPLVLLEAMGAGMGVVAFDCPTGPRDVVEHRANGLLVPNGDVDGLAAALCEMIEDESLRAACAAAARRTAQSYTMEAVGPSWLRLLEELRATRRAAGPPKAVVDPEFGDEAEQLEEAIDAAERADAPCGDAPRS